MRPRTAIRLILAILILGFGCKEPLVIDVEEPVAPEPALDLGLPDAGPPLPTPEDAGVEDATVPEDASVPDDASMPEPWSTRFSATAEIHSVPASGAPEGFFHVSSATAGRQWSLFDIDGDGLPDIVQTSDTATGRVWDAAASPYWKVFPNVGETWSASPLEWRVPSNGIATGFFAVAGPSWETLDIDGDGRADLVHTADPSTGKVWDVAGTPHWKVYRNNGAGFDLEATLWSVPPLAGNAYGFFNTQGTSAGNWATFDLDGDGRPDLVHTSDPSTGFVWDASGEPHWKLFSNSGSGFEEVATHWKIPESGTTWGFHLATDNQFGRFWSTFDLDADGRPDLVQTANPATSQIWDATGDPYWKVFLGAEGGFALEPLQWRVPRSGLPDGFFTRGCATSYRYWATTDIDGDGALDLVQTGDTSHSARTWDATGSPYWKVFRNLGNGFSAELIRWSIPVSGTSEGFFATRWSYGASHWAVVHVDSDGRPDLVQTADPATTRVWDAMSSPYWKVFSGVP